MEKGRGGKAQAFVEYDGTADGLRRALEVALMTQGGGSSSKQQQVGSSLIQGSAGPGPAPRPDGDMTRLEAVVVRLQRQISLAVELRGQVNKRAAELIGAVPAHADLDLIGGEQGDGMVGRLERTMSDLEELMGRLSGDLDRLDGV